MHTAWQPVSLLSYAKSGATGQPQDANQKVLAAIHRALVCAQHTHMLLAQRTQPPPHLALQHLIQQIFGPFVHVVIGRDRLVCKGRGAMLDSWEGGVGSCNV